MTHSFTIDRALTDRNLLGAALDRDTSSWATWLAVLKAAFALPLSTSEEAVFRVAAGGRLAPTKRVRELWCVVGRRGGKSKIAAAIAVYLALFVKHPLTPGETGYVLVLAMSRSQAQVVCDYARAFIESSAVLREVESATATEIRLKNGITIATHANSFRSVRGKTLVAAILDETSFWRDETSASPDVEVFRAIRPSLATTDGMVVGISTPYRRAGLLHQKHHDHYGHDGDDVLVVQGPSILFNPRLTPQVIAQAMADDPEGSAAEWEAEFRSDLSAFLSDELIDQAVDHGRPLELPPRSGLRYRAFVDPSGGRHDAYTLCVGHREGERFVADAVRGTRPGPFDPQAVTREYVALVKDYKLVEVVGDNYSAAWVETAWRDCGVKYVRSELNKSALYLEALPLWTRGCVAVPDHPRLLRELRLLERRASRVGKDVIDHPRNATDDHANAVCGLLALLAAKPTYDTSLRWVDGDPEDAAAEWQRMSLQHHLFANH